MHNSYCTFLNFSKQLPTFALKMKRFIQILLLFCISAGVHAQNYTPSESAKISLLTCTPGEAIYSQFGHSALRLKDSVEQIDIVFDYGAFYINDIPRFVWNFLTGKTYYILDIRSFYQTLWAYRYEGRGIIEQELNLTPSEVKRIGDFLIWNIQPENQEYLYNFFTDNCATRIRDIFEREFPSIQWNHSYAPETWRNILVNRYMGNQSWTSFGANMALGVQTDRPATTNQMMFLPDVLSESLSTATIDNGNRKLANDKKIILEAREIKSPAFFGNAPLILWIIVLFFLGISIAEFNKKKRFFWCDTLFFTIAGIFGCLLWFLSFASIHSFVFPNCNLLWLTPFHLLFVILSPISQIRAKTNVYTVFSAVMTIISVIVSLIVGQYIPLAAFPIMVILALRALPNLYGGNAKQPA